MKTLYQIIEKNSKSHTNKKDISHKSLNKKNDSMQIYLQKLEQKYQWEKTNNFLLNYSENLELTQKISNSFKNNGLLKNVFKSKNLVKLVKSLFEFFEDVIANIQKY
jgi:hypothetical protein